MLNNTQVKELFEREAVLLGSSDGVPCYRAEELFGEKAVKFATRLKTGENSNCFGIGDYDLWYLTLKGFRMAAAYSNVLEIKRRTEGARENVSA